ncbi:MAG: S49 family peptidase [Gammaproteobacteria bacterium]|nr:S49 family peptidase [Gammaproteobacteria bacterium]MDH5728378.1 S49 family peptidase [Gammaproteobacteria bacterium]
MSDETNKPGSNESNGDDSVKDPWTESPSQADSVEKSGTAQALADAQQKIKEKNQHANEDEESQDWQRDLINRLAFASLNEQRRSRRWSIFFKSLFFVYLFSLFLVYMPDDGSDLAVGKHTAVIEVSGPIMDGALASADSVITSMRKAFKESNARAIVLRVNSPGGSAVQAGYIYDEIVRLRKKYPDKKLYSVVTDMCASAAYYIASASDAIYVDKASLVGSIGVLTDGFGFVEGIKKLGVERRLLTAGENKGFLDPFSPLTQSDKRHMKSILDNVHVQFIEAVKRGRGDRLLDHDDLFSGLIWTGERSIALGLSDGYGSTSSVARDVVNAERLVDYTLHPGYLDRFAERIGVSVANTLSLLFTTPTIMR